MARDLVEHAAHDPVALVFGRERFGLTNDEIGLCSHQVSIPANPDYGILNLSQAVQVLAYETFKAWRRRPRRLPAGAARRAPARPQEQGQCHFHDHLGRVMQRSGFITQPHARTGRTCPCAVRPRTAPPAANSLLRNYWLCCRPTCPGRSATTTAQPTNCRSKRSSMLYTYGLAMAKPKAISGML